MTKRSLLLTLCAALLLVCALSTDAPLFFLLFWSVVLMEAIGFVSALWTIRTLTIQSAVSTARVTRGAQVSLSIRARHACPLPSAALLLDIRAAADDPGFAVYAPIRPYRANLLNQSLYCPHVGAYDAGVSGVRAQDVFGLFSFYRAFGTRETTLVVQPQVYTTPAPPFSPGESDTESAMARAFEDATLPTDVRVYQPGDELKKVHWKLSMRRRELLVRVYEQPMRPDALLLIDCAPPDPGLSGAAAMRDAICEAAASLAAVALSEGAPVRMPLLSATPSDVNASKPEDIQMVLDALGRCAFDGAEQFERVLLLETRRLRRTGSTVIVTSRMNPVIADMILRIRRMGPKVRVMLAANASDEAVAQLVHRLMRNDVEVMPISAELA